jgi:hypothetical protein
MPKCRPGECCADCAESPASRVEHGEGRIPISPASQSVVDRSALHHGVHTRERRDIFERIAGNSGHVHKFAGHDRVNLNLPAEQLHGHGNCSQLFRTLLFAPSSGNSNGRVFINDSAGAVRSSGRLTAGSETKLSGHFAGLGIKNALPHRNLAQRVSQLTGSRPFAQVVPGPVVDLRPNLIGRRETPKTRFAAGFCAGSRL